MADDPNLDSAYALSSPEDNIKLYRAWADTYDSGFVKDQGYVLHQFVAERFADLSGTGPVLDIGAGTGLCGAALTQLGIGPIHATDISADMLKVATGKGIYETLFQANLLEGLPSDTDAFAGAVSSGTFTLGHIGPEALDEVRRVVRPGGLVVISINAQHFEDAGFAAYFDANADKITDVSHRETRIYAKGAPGPHADDIAYLMAFRPK